MQHLLQDFPCIYSICFVNWWYDKNFLSMSQAWLLWYFHTWPITYARSKNSQNICCCKCTNWGTYQLILHYLVKYLLTFLRHLTWLKIRHTLHHKSSIVSSLFVLALLTRRKCSGFFYWNISVLPLKIRCLSFRSSHTHTWIHIACIKTIWLYQWFIYTF